MTCKKNAVQFSHLFSSLTTKQKKLNENRNIAHTWSNVLCSNKKIRSKITWPYLLDNMSTRSERFSKIQVIKMLCKYVIIDQGQVKYVNFKNKWHIHTEFGVYSKINITSDILKCTMHTTLKRVRFTIGRACFWYRLYLILYQFKTTIISVIFLFHKNQWRKCRLIQKWLLRLSWVVKKNYKCE